MRKRVFIIPFLIISLMILLIDMKDNYMVRDIILVISIFLFIIILFEMYR